MLNERKEKDDESHCELSLLAARESNLKHKNVCQSCASFDDCYVNFLNNSYRDIILSQNSRDIFFPKTESTEKQHRSIMNLRGFSFELP